MRYLLILRQGGGAPLRNFYGEVTASRGHPRDPNLRSDQYSSFRAPAVKSNLVNSGSETLPPQPSAKDDLLQRNIT